jgi:hypothetical protein
MSTARAIDHPQIAVEDVAAAMADYRRLGFTLSPQMRHSFGTSNCLIVFRQDYMELIGDFGQVTDPAWRARLDPLARRPGMAHLGLYSTDADADRRDYLARGGQPNAVDTFTRPVPLPGGGEDLVRCSVCGVVRPGYSGIILFACHQHRPDLVWFPELQAHANTAQAVTAITYGAVRPAAHQDYFELMVGPGSTALEGEDLIVATGRGGRIEVLTPAGLAARFGDDAAGMAIDDHGVAVRIRVASLAAAEAVLVANGVPHTRAAGALRVPPSAARGVVLEFVS